MWQKSYDPCQEYIDVHQSISDFIAPHSKKAPLNDHLLTWLLMTMGS